MQFQSLNKICNESYLSVKIVGFISGFDILELTKSNVFTFSICSTRRCKKNLRSLLIQTDSGSLIIHSSYKHWGAEKLWLLPGDVLDFYEGCYWEMCVLVLAQFWQPLHVLWALQCFAFLHLSSWNGEISWKPMSLDFYAVFLAIWLRHVTYGWQEVTWMHPKCSERVSKNKKPSSSSSHCFSVEKL